MNRLTHVSLVIDLGTSDEVRQAANAPVSSNNWIPLLEQLIAQRKFK